MNVPFPDGIYLMQNNGGKTYADLINAGRGTGGLVQGHDIVVNEGFPNQYWFIERVTDHQMMFDNQYRMINLKTAGCLELDNGSKEDHTKVFSRERMDNMPECYRQHWLITEEPNEPGSYRIQNLAAYQQDDYSGFLDLTDGSGETHTQIQGYHRTRFAAQVWTFVRRSLMEHDIVAMADHVNILKTVKTRGMGSKYPFMKMPNAMYKTLYDSSNEQSMTMRPGVFDEQAKIIEFKGYLNTWAYQNLAANGYTLFAGMIFGMDDTQQRASMFLIDDSMEKMMFLDTTKSAIEDNPPDIMPTVGMF